MSEPVRVLLVTGSTRAGSGNTAALATAAAVAPAGVTAVVYDGLARLPAFNPDDDGDHLPAEVARLREEITAADAVLFCTPEYAGTLPGSFKNRIPVDRAAVTQDGTISDPEFTAEAVQVWDALLDSLGGR